MEEEKGYYTDDEIREMFKGLPEEEIEWALQMNAETRENLTAMHDTLQEIEDNRQIYVDMLADSWREEGEELKRELGEIEGQKELDRRKEAQKDKNIIPWNKNR